MKKLLCILLIFCLAGCCAAENPEKTDITVSEIKSGAFVSSESSSSDVFEETVSSEESSSENVYSEDFSFSESESSSVSESEKTGSYSEEGVFHSYDELAEYLSENTELFEYITDEKVGICIWVPQNLPEKYKLNMIKIHGSYITYYYENTENPVEVFKLEWAFKASDAEKLLQNSLNFSYSEIAERSGCYVSPVYSMETGEQEAFKILWAENGFCFSAITSEEIFESFKNGMNLIKKEVYV